MGNHDFAIRQKQGFLSQQNQYLGKGHDTKLVIGHNDDIQSGQVQGPECHLSDADDQGLATTNQAQENDLSVQMENGSIDKVEEKELGLDEVNTDIKEDNDQFTVTDQSRDFGSSDNHELALVESLDVHENLQSDGQQEHPEMSIIPALDMFIEQPQSVINPPVLQSRPVIPVPDHQLSVGQEFPDVQSCRRALRDAAIALRFEMQTVKSDKSRFTAKCASSGCPWRIHAAKLPGVPNFSIRTIHNEHICGGINHLGHQQASVQWVADAVAEHLKENPHYKPKEILEEIHRVHGITLSYKQAWRGKERIMAAVRGSFEQDYRLLPWYCNLITITNPGSMALVYADSVVNCFQRLFVSYHASIFGFLNACRPLIALDKTLLTNKYLGTLMLASGFDGEGSVFPLAFAVVDEENDDNWIWFISELRNLLEINAENMPKLTILSDRQKAIVDGVEANFPTAFHGFCMSHLSDSFQREFNNPMIVNLFWEAAHALTNFEFDQKILQIREISPAAFAWIQNIPPRFWANAYFEGTRFGHVTANVADSLKSWIHEASSLPIIQMMECFRRKLMILFNECRERSMQWTGTLVPSAEGHVLGAIEHASAWRVLKANEAEFEVVSQEGAFRVDIRNRSCWCRGWELQGLPCTHAVAVLHSCRQNVHRFTESYFTVANYRKAYSQTIHPVPDKTLWKDMLEQVQGQEESEAEVIIRPPKSLQPPARPRKRRVRTEGVGGRAKRVVHCSRCNQTGHFRTTCATPI
ncbi:hypothetical protein SLA2020_197240 [Shorea laevis]